MFKQINNVLIENHQLFRFLDTNSAIQILLNLKITYIMDLGNDSI